VTETPGDRIRKLLLRADNTLKNHAGSAGDAARVARATRTLEEAREVARDPGVAPEVRELVQRRLDGLSAPEGADDGPAVA